METPLARLLVLVYIRGVPSKKDGIGIGLPTKPCDESRRTPRGLRLCRLRPQFLVARRAGASLAGFRKGFPVDQPVEPPPSIGLGSSGFCKSKPLEAIHG